MPDYQFTFTVQGISPQRATAIRDKLAQRLGDDQVDVLMLGFSRMTANYRAIGVDTAGSAVFTQTTEAPDEATARQQVIGTSTTRVIASIEKL